MKKCTKCDKSYLRGKRESFADWDKRMYCSQICSNKSKMTKKVRDKISKTCKEKGIGKWMIGSVRGPEAIRKHKEKMATLVESGKHNFWKGGRKQNHCLDCSKPITYYRSRCLSCAHSKGENHPMWKGGITPVNHALRNSNQYKEWRTGVFTRDGFKCKINNADCVHEVHAHHILRFADYPELRFEISNGITLCKNHHPMKRSHEQELAPLFKSLIT